MVEAGAQEVPEETLLQAFELAHREIVKLCEAQEELREQAGKPKWLDPEVTADLKGRYGDTLRQEIAMHGLREAGAVVETIEVELCPELTMESTEEDILRRVQVRSSLAALLESARMEAVEQPVREQFLPELEALTEAERDSKELKSAKRGLLFDRILEGAQLPFPVGTAAEGEAPVKDAMTKQFLKRAADAIYKDLVRKKIAVHKRRPDGRGSEDIRPITCEVGVSPRTHGSALVHARADADHVAAHPRHRQGGAAHRRPLPRVGSPVHAPLQLPALLGRRDRASCAGRSGATSATGRSRSGRSSR